MTIEGAKNIASAVERSQAGNMTPRYVGAPWEKFTEEKS